MPYVLPPSSFIEASPQLAPTFHKQPPMAIPTRQQAPSLSFSAFETQDASDVSSGGTAVPFPKIPGRKRRVRGVGSQPWHLTPSESSDEEDVSPRQPPPVVAPPAPVVHTPPTPVPGRHRNLRLNLEGLNRRALSESQIPTLSASSPSTPQLRKKNGELLKSSLKSPSSSSIRSSRSSMPTTPSMEKIVHFDAQLEYVKLFNKEQKPAAVSRDASPCDSEDDSDRQLIIGRSKKLESSEDEKVRQGLTLESINAPLRNAEDLMGGSDVKLEKVSLAPGGRTIQGTVLVRNLAFEKWIAIRFTFDWWQTISEVTAKYLDSLPEQNLDRFEWSLRVPDIALSKIEERRLFLVVRYNTAGREIWDNNNGENYQYKFKVVNKAAAAAPRSSINDSRHPPSWPVKSANTDQLADLRKKLERVVQEDEESKGLSSWESLTAKLRARNIHLEEDKDSSNLQLKKRYNFSEAAKSKWEPPKDIPRLKELPRMLSVPLPAHRGSSASPARGSPRDSELGHSPKFFIDPRDGDSWSHHQPTISPRSSGHRGRQHQRGGYFCDWESSVKLTPTSSNTSPDQSRSPSSSPSVASTMDTSVHSEDFKLSEPSAQDASELSESESCSSTTSSSTEEANNNNTKSSVSVTAPAPTQQPFGMDRSAMRFNSYPMDRSHLTPPAPATEQHVQPAPISAWTLSDSVDSIASTPSITSASTPSQCPSSPLESLPDSFAYGGDPFASIESRRTLQQSAYDYFLSRFCYYTGAESNDFRGHRQSHSDSNLSAWSGSNVHPPTHRRYSSEGMGYTASKYEYPTADLPRVPETESGATTPTQTLAPKLPDFPAPKGMVTPRAGSPVQNSDLERTPRQTETFVRPVRSSL